VTDISDQDSMGTDTNVANVMLPIGVHPNDPGEPVVPGFGTNAAAPPDTVGNRYSTGAPPWKVENSEATPVFERASHDFSANVIVANSNSNGGTAVAAGRVKGRKAVTLSVPATLSTGLATPAGVVWGPTEDSVQQPAGTFMPVLNVGDSVTIATEAHVYVGVIPGQPTGYVQVVEEINPPGGALGTGQ
jgi:hypothetical protein